jgi:hypothetical protein
LFTGVVDTRDIFMASVIVTGDNCSKVTMTPAINLLPLSTTPPITENQCQRLIAGAVDTSELCQHCHWHHQTIIASVVDTANKLSFPIISANF